MLARDTLKIAIVGDIDAETAGRLLDSTFGELPAKADLTPVANVVPQGMGRRIVIELDVPQAVVTFGGPGIARNDPDFMAAYIVNHILGGGSFSSRLYARSAREARPRLRRLNHAWCWLDHAALLLGGTATRADATGETLAIIEKEFRRLAEEGPDGGRARQGQDLPQGLLSRSVSTPRARLPRSSCSSSSTTSASTTSSAGPA